MQIGEPRFWKPRLMPESQDAENRFFRLIFGGCTEGVGGFKLGVGGSDVYKAPHGYERLDGTTYFEPSRRLKKKVHRNWFEGIDSPPDKERRHLSATMPSRESLKRGL